MSDDVQKGIKLMQEASRILVDGAFQEDTALLLDGGTITAVGPTDNFSHMPAYVKLVLSFCMIAGRLEIFTVLVLFEPHFWKR